jgi:putative peptide modification system cyclase
MDSHSRAHLQGDEAALPQTPQMRAVLCADLVDSTALVERLGDIPAAELMRRHDRMARDLLQRHRGQEIDKSDGFLLLFGRALDAVAFALAYQRALALLGQDLGQVLQARVGIHLGEVMLRANAREDVAKGAKPIEVEGLAKPVAARLMGLARPGQILLSGAAFTLAQRAVGELGDAGRAVRWLTHGRYRFKGVPQSQLIHEVGEAGLAPLKPPPSGGKAWRDAPLWRRPAALALEAIAALLVLGIAFSVLLRPAPVIAFAERDWLVMGDVRDLTGQGGLAEALDVAFRVGVEQSRYVNLIPSLKVHETLQLMGLPPDSALQRELAIEVAQREGARAVLLPTVAEVGGRLRVSAELIDPGTGTTVYAESADGVGEASLLASVDQVHRALRQRLGEALRNIEATDAPLPRVTTGNLDALRAFAAGLRAHQVFDYPRALAHFEQALELDPEFAAAELRMGLVHYAADDRESARRYVDRALAHTDRLTARSRLELSAMDRALDDPEAALDRFAALHDLYPDEFSAAYRFALFAYEHGLRYREALARLRAAQVAQNPYRGGAHYLAGTLHFLLGETEDARREFAQAEALGRLGRALVYADFLASQRRYAEAEAALLGGTRVGLAAADVPRLLRPIAHAVDRGDGAEARLAWELAASAAQEAGPSRAMLHAQIGLQLEVLGTPPARAREAIATFMQQEAAALPARRGALREQALFGLQLAGLLAASEGHADLLEVAIQTSASGSDPLRAPVLGRQALLLSAERLRLSGRAREAVALLRGRLNDDSGYLHRVLLLRALREAGAETEALRAAEALLAERGRAFADWNLYVTLQPWHVFESNRALLQAAELAERQGQAARAAELREQLHAAWPWLPPGATASGLRLSRGALPPPDAAAAGPAAP